VTDMKGRQRGTRRSESHARRAHPRSKVLPEPCLALALALALDFMMRRTCSAGKPSSSRPPLCVLIAHRSRPQHLRSR